MKISKSLILASLLIFNAIPNSVFAADACKTEAQAAALNVAADANGTDPANFSIQSTTLEQSDNSGEVTYFVRLGELDDEDQPCGAYTVTLNQSDCTVIAVRQ